MGKNNKSTHPTLKAAKTFNRRSALKRGAAVFPPATANTEPTGTPETSASNLK